MLVNKEFIVGQAPYHIYAQVILLGTDLAVMLGGGTAPHIGAVAVGQPCESWVPGKIRTATAYVLCVPGHKEDEFARNAANLLATALNTTVTVSVGIHIDDASVQDIQTLTRNFDELIDQVAHWALSLPEFPTNKPLLF